MPALLVLMITCALGASRPAEAAPIVIQFEARDISDVTPGEDLWQYEYIVSDYVFAADQGFSIYFEPGLSSALRDPAPVNADWDLIAVQPDAVLPSDGFLDALALSTGASLADRFVIAFVWLGGAGTRPGSQPFTLNQFDPTGGLTVLETGLTVQSIAPPQPVPEPSALAMLAVACAGAICRSGRRRRR